jgi:hypothetical protein
MNLHRVTPQLTRDIRSSIEAPPLRILVIIPHFFGGLDANATNRSTRPGARDERLRALMATIASLHQAFGTNVYGLDHFRHTAWQADRCSEHILDVVVCTTGGAYLLDAAPSLATLYRHHRSTVEPRMLGFECHRLLRDARGRYDYYAYVEDDIVITDPLFFRKRRLFDQVFGPDALLQPNRYEVRSDGPVHKLYVDYRIRPQLTAAHQKLEEEPSLALPFLDDAIRFERTPYPSAGCFFLNDEQLRRWVDGPAFLDGDVSYLSPLDSAATLSVMKSFRIYKAVLNQAWFLEVLHASPRWITSVTEQTTLMPSDSPLSPSTQE